MYRIYLNLLVTLFLGVVSSGSSVIAAEENPLPNPSPFADSTYLLEAEKQYRRKSASPSDLVDASTSPSPVLPFSRKPSPQRGPSSRPSSAGSVSSEGSIESIGSVVVPCRCSGEHKKLTNVTYHYAPMFGGKSTEIHLRLQQNLPTTRLCIVDPSENKSARGMLVRNGTGDPFYIIPDSIIHQDTDINNLRGSLISPLILPSSNGYSTVIVDEAQFLNQGQVHQFEELAKEFPRIEFLFYGLKRDFLQRPFPVMEHFDSFSNFQRSGNTALCPCGKRGICSVRISPANEKRDSWVIVKQPGLVVAPLGGEYHYVTVCQLHWNSGLLVRLSEQIQKTLAKNAAQSIINPRVSAVADAAQHGAGTGGAAAATPGK